MANQVKEDTRLGKVIEGLSLLFSSLGGSENEAIKGIEEEVKKIEAQESGNREKLEIEIKKGANISLKGTIVKKAKVSEKEAEEKIGNKHTIEQEEKQLGK